MHVLIELYALFKQFIILVTKQMATIETNKQDDIDCILYVTTSKHSTGGFYGYKTGYLEQPLNQMECSFLICPSCDGIMKNASVWKGKITCFSCSKNPNFSDQVESVKSSVLKVSIKCPLETGCEWKGKISEAVEHLKVCEYFRELCPLECGGVVKRGDMGNHKKQVCPLHEVKCWYCDGLVKFLEVIGHEINCPKRPVKCSCEKEMKHDEHAMHIEKECPLVEVECPFVKYGCDVGKIVRKNLMEHKREYYVRHQDMLEEENCMLRARILKLNTKLKFKKDIDSVEFNIPESDAERDHHGPIFNSCNSKFTIFAHTGESLSIGLNRSRSILLDDSVTHYHLTMTLPGDDLAFHHEECSVANYDSEGQAKLFSVSKETYSDYVQSDGSLSLKLYYSNRK